MLTGNIPQIQLHPDSAAQLEPKIPPNATLIFYVTLVSFESKAPTVWR